MKFSIKNVKVTVSYLSVALISFALVSSAKGQRLVLICLLCTFFHECGHLFMICRFKGKPKRICINPFEIQIIATNKEQKLKEEVLITSFGVVANLFLASLSFLFYLVFFAEIFKEICISSFMIGFLNLLPLETFDGGQLLRIFLLRFLSIRTVNVIMVIISTVAIIPIAFLGIAVLFLSEFNFSILFIAVYLFYIFISKELW